MVNKSFIYRFQFVVLIAFVVAGLFFMYQTKVGLSLEELFLGNRSTLYVGTVPLNVEVADSSDELTLGLSGRDGLSGIDGLLMVFNKPDYHGIWMKDMLFPISVVWISEDLVVVDITRELLPSSYPKVYEPASPAKYALETEAFFPQTRGIKVGDTVVLPKSLK